MNPFWKLQVKASFVVRLFNLSLSFRTKSAENHAKICDLPDKLQSIFELGLKKYGMIVEKSLLEKRIFENSHVFVFMSIATVQI